MREFGSGLKLILLKVFSALFFFFFFEFERKKIEKSQKGPLHRDN